LGKWDEHDPLYNDMSFPENKKLKKLKKLKKDRGGFEKSKRKKKVKSQRKKRLKSQRSKGYHKGAKINERVFK